MKCEIWIFVVRGLAGGVLGEGEDGGGGGQRRGCVDVDEWMRMRG